MSDLSEALRSASAAETNGYRPVILRPTVAEDRARLVDLLKRGDCITVHDRLHAQLRELVKALTPSVKWESAALDLAAIAHLQGQEAADYGAWVHYPWSNRLVHLLDEQEYALVRTDRNRNKITKEEQAVLASKRVGVIGLSVGQSVSLALAMERSFGELRLADFDSLDLSNLNRIRSGSHQLGLNKAVVAAREIAEIDPYLKVTVFAEGITEANIDAFFTEGGRLDLLVEECDDPIVKVLARDRARRNRIPVVMDTSDRGLIDLERFDLEPDREFCHGRIQGFRMPSPGESMAPEARYDLIMSMVGRDTLSDRMKSSLAEIGRTISTWPQLGSHVMMGGAVAADMARRVMLGQMEWSGRWWIDLEELTSTERSATK